MVNLPSQPNLRPVDPSSLGASVRHAFSLPPPGPRLRTDRGQFEISNLSFEITLLPVAVRKDHQGRIKAETPVIVPHQGKSRQTPYFQTAVRSANHPLDWADRQTDGKTFTKEKSSPGGEDTGEGERHHQSIPVCAPCRQSRQKPQQSCLIKANQGKRSKSHFRVFRVFRGYPFPAFPKSENREPFPLPPIRANQTKSNRPVPLSRISRFPPPVIGCWEFDVGCWMFPPFPPFPAIKPNQGKNPSNQGLSCLIKANAKFPKRARPRAQQPPILPTSNRHPSPEFPLCAFATPRLCVKAQHPPAPVPT